MKKETTPSAWESDTKAVDQAFDAEYDKLQKSRKAKPVESEPLFDLEGLMTDFPTAKELEKFVFDQTGHVLNLKGRSNKFKYQTAMDVLNGQVPDKSLLGSENPYLDKNDLIPIDPMKTIPPQPEEIRGVPMVTQFMSKTFPHPDDDWKASGQKCDVVFKKYINNVITYEILGPIAPRAIGTRVNKFGKEVPEKYTWVDPRTGEQIIRNMNGMLTPLGSRLRQAMIRMKVNKSNAWDVWIDRDFVIAGNDNMSNDPWAI